MTPEERTLLGERYTAARDKLIAGNDEAFGKGNWSASMGLYMMEQPWSQLSKCDDDTLEHYARIYLKPDYQA